MFASVTAASSRLPIFTNQRRSPVGRNRACRPNARRSTRSHRGCWPCRLGQRGHPAIRTVPGHGAPTPPCPRPRPTPPRDTSRDSRVRAREFAGSLGEFRSRDAGAPSLGGAVLPGANDGGEAIRSRPERVTIDPGQDRRHLAAAGRLTEGERYTPRCARGPVLDEDGSRRERRIVAGERGRTLVGDERLVVQPGLLPNVTEGQKQTTTFVGSQTSRTCERPRQRARNGSQPLQRRGNGPHVRPRGSRSDTCVRGRRRSRSAATASPRRVRRRCSASRRPGQPRDGDGARPVREAVVDDVADQAVLEPVAEWPVRFEESTELRNRG